ncbi:hypothetical protein EVAR_36917_1 [Eumeta japonica]|uniref:Uncharacterized protein n=1 Tax=Eumeta variegata TaxID=151549 RepID=A0A4C1X864_EUMVA|nr:hypothetical protein EVAR_36917_1 [Eumeta japonica]
MRVDERRVPSPTRPGRPRVGRVRSRLDQFCQSNRLIMKKYFDNKNPTRQTNGAREQGQHNEAPVLRPALPSPSVTDDSPRPILCRLQTIRFSETDRVCPNARSTHRLKTWERSNEYLALHCTRRLLAVRLSLDELNQPKSTESNQVLISKSRHHVSHQLSGKIFFPDEVPRVMFSNRDDSATARLAEDQPPDSDGAANS